MVGRRSLRELVPPYDHWWFTIIGGSRNATEGVPYRLIGYRRRVDWIWRVAGG